MRIVAPPPRSGDFWQKKKMALNWSCDLRANEKPQKKLHEKGTWNRQTEGQTSQLYERISQGPILWKVVTVVTVKNRATYFYFFLLSTLKRAIWQPVWCSQESVLRFLRCFFWWRGCVFFSEVEWFSVWIACMVFVCGEVVWFFSLTHSSCQIFFWRLHDFFLCRDFCEEVF